MKTKSPHNGKPAKKRNGTKKDPSSSYNEFKEFAGQQYTGMKVGRRHKWYYDKGEWKERKLTPDKWEFTFEVIKRRAGKAPDWSGVPVGTEYHWYIIADQSAIKLDANSYSTSMSGFKYKVAHKRADKEKWSISDRAQRKRQIKILQEMISELEKESPEVNLALENKEGGKSKSPVEIKKKVARPKRELVEA